MPRDGDPAPGKTTELGRRPGAWRARGVLLDLDDTLYGYRTAARHALSELARILSRDFHLSPELVVSRYQECRTLVREDASEAGLPLRHERMRLLLEAFPHIPGAAATFCAESYGTAFLEAVRWFPGAQEAFRALTCLVPVVVVTEGHEDIAGGILDRLGPPADSAPRLCSRSLLLRKGDGSAFLKALEWLRLAPEEVVMIGDNWENDVVGASLADIRSIWIDPQDSTVSLPRPRWFLEKVPDLYQACRRLFPEAFPGVGTHV